MQILEKIQGVIERTYDLESEHRVSDFVVTCPEFARAFGLRPDATALQEQVLVRGDSATVDLAVCLDQQVLTQLRDHDPMALLHDGNLEAFWTALEGVSHFVYLVWNVSRRRQVTQLELELQAEVDKFVTTALLVAAQQGGRVPTELHSWLFDLCRLDESLAQEEADRYARANRYAGRFCQQLASRYLRSGGDSMFPEIRRFYRLSQRGKLRHIESARPRNR
jgi:hypothetical protein